MLKQIERESIENRFCKKGEDFCFAAYLLLCTRRFGLVMCLEYWSEVMAAGIIEI
jgi:hypothetical protein